MNARILSVLHSKPFFCLATTMALLHATGTQAANIWDGGGVDNNWSTPENWDNDMVPSFPVALVFDGATGLSPYNDLESKTVNGFTFNADTASFVVDGNAITLGGNIVNDSTNLQTIDLDMTLPATRIVTLSGGGDVRLGGSLNGTGGITVSGNGELTLAGNNSYAGNTTLNGSSTTSTQLNIAHANALGIGKLNLSNVTGQTLSFDNASGATLAIANDWDIPTSILVTFVGTNDLAINGTTTLKAGSVKINVADGTLTLAKIDADTTARTLSKSGDGTLFLPGAAGSTFQGGVSHGAGTLILGHKDALGSGNFGITNGSSVVLQASTDLSGANKLPNSMSGFLGILTVSGANNIELGGKLSRTATTTDMRLNNNLDAGRTLTLNDVDINDGATARRFLLGGSGLTVVNGTIANGHATTNHGLTKNGTGTLVLNGDNTYRGTTQVNDGTVVAAKPTSVPNYGTSGQVAVAAGATLAVKAGAAGQWIAGDIATLLGTTAFAAGSAFGLEIGASNTFTYNGDLGLVQANKGFNKSGAGTLTLIGTQTYTGSTTVAAGTLLLDGGSITGNATVHSGATLGGDAIAFGGLLTVEDGGTLAPGNSPSVATVGGLDLQPGSTLAIELFGLDAGSGYDQVIVTGNSVAIADGAILDLTLGFAARRHDTFLILDNWGSDTNFGGFLQYGGTLLGEGTIFNIGVYQFGITYAHVAGTDQLANDILLTVLIPEPTSALLLALAGLALMKRRH